MALEKMPDDILIIIIRYLDFASLSNLYHISSHIRNLLATYKVIQTCNISFNTMATVHTLQSNLFTDVSHSLIELNMCGVHNLTKSALMSVMHRLKSLKTLDISYTDLHLLDFVDIYSLCPTINKIKINFSFGTNQSDKLSNSTIIKCQETFKNFECVHFVGSLYNLMHSEIALVILSKAYLKNLQFTIIEYGDELTYDNGDSSDLGQFEHLIVCFLNENSEFYDSIEDMMFFSNLSFQNYEFVSMNWWSFSEKPTVFSSPVFSNFFLERFNIKTDSEDAHLIGKVCIMLWQKNKVTIDEDFFEALSRKIKSFFPYYFEDNGMSLDTAHEWYLTNQRSRNSVLENINKKKKVTNFTLNYDEEFKEKQELELTLVFKCDIESVVTLSSNILFLSKLTYLNLCGEVRYSDEFFDILFRFCDKLLTLNVETCTVSKGISSSISRSMLESHTLRNFRIVDDEIDFNSLFTSLSQCSNIENIIVTNHSDSELALFDPTTMIQRCPHLYCVCICQKVNQEIHSMQMKVINEAMMKCNKTHINFKIYNNYHEFYYNPCIDVFKLCPIKPLQLF